MAYNEQTGAGVTKDPQPPSSFNAIFGAILEQGGNVVTNILEAKGQRELAVEEAKKQTEVQSLYTQLGQSSPNLGSNDPPAAETEAVKQTDLMTGILTGQQGMIGLVILLLAAVGLVAVFLRGRK